MLALPGSAYLYQGEELGLPEVIDLPDDARQDPTLFRTDGERYGRDGCRVPLPWEADAPSYGFGPTDASWLPQPAQWAELARDRQRGVEGSTLELYRAALAPAPRARPRLGHAGVAAGLPRRRRRVPQRRRRRRREHGRRARGAARWRRAARELGRSTGRTLPADTTAWLAPDVVAAAATSLCDLASAGTARIRLVLRASCPGWSCGTQRDVHRRRRCSPRRTSSRIPAATSSHCSMTIR